MGEVRLLCLPALLAFAAFAACTQDEEGCKTAGAERLGGICECPPGSTYVKQTDECVGIDAGTSSAESRHDSGRAWFDGGRMEAGASSDGAAEDRPDSMPGADGGLSATCPNEGELRCPMQGSGLRQRCERAVWVDIEPCSAGQVCSAAASGESGDCREQTKLCAGAAGRAVCDGSEMIICDASGVVERTSSCGSERQCELGLGQGSCATCAPGTFRCQGAMLEKCSDDGARWASMQPACSSAALCNAQAGACTSSACLADSKSCAGDVLQRCNETLTAFVEEKTCGKGLCDAPGKQCDVCVPGTTSCDGGRVTTCDAQGQAFTTEDCPSDRRVCTGNGKCVQCTQPSDCPPPNDCTTATCNVAAGTCGTTFKMAGTECSAGVCDGKGSCGPAPRCGDAAVNQRSEECDDGNLIQEDDCRNDCKRASCGDGVLNRFGTRREDCDLTAGANEWACSSDCRKLTIYNPCTTVAACNQGELCIGGICTKECAPLGAVGRTSGCPTPPGRADAYCNAGIGICHAGNCDTNADCHPETTCAEYDVGGPAIRSLCGRHFE